MFLWLVTRRLYSWHRDSEKKQTDRWESTICSFIFVLLSHVYKYWLEQPFPQWASGTSVQREGSLRWSSVLFWESFLICNWANVSIFFPPRLFLFFFLSADNQIKTVLSALNWILSLNYAELKRGPYRGEVFILSLCFIRTSEGIWFYLSRAICVPLIVFSRCVLRVFSLSLLSPPDLSPELSLSLFALLCRSESVHPRPHSRMTTFWYADTQTQVRPVQVHPTVVLTRSESPRSSRVRPRAQQAPGAGHRGPPHPRDETPDWHEEECLMWPRAGLCYRVTMPLISSSSCYFLVDRPWQTPLSL